MPNLTWYGSPNFTPGRTDVEYVVIHWMDGYLAGADVTFQNTVRQTSAHYGVEDDTIHQYVNEANTAWHAGNFDANTRSIGIEHSAMPGRPASDATYASTIWLITGICQRYGLDPTVAILPHKHFTSTDCPGTMDLPRIIAGVQAALGVTPQSGTITPIQEADMTPDESAQLKAVYDAIFNGGKSMKYGASLQGLIDDIPRRVREEVAVTRGPVKTSLAQELADTNTHAMAALGALITIAQGVGDLKAKPAAAAATVDITALATQLAPLLNTGNVDQFIAAVKTQWNK